MSNNNFYDVLRKTYQDKENYKYVNCNIKEKTLTLLFLKGMVDIKYFFAYIYPYINEKNYGSLDDNFKAICSKLTILTLTNVDYLLSTGNLILMIANENDVYYYHFSLMNLPSRSINESQLDPTNLFQARDGLIESASTNLLLIKNRIKTPNLIVKKYVLGNITNTDTYLLYLNDFKNKNYIKQIETTLSSTSLHAVTNINTISNLFDKKSIFPLSNCSGSPELLCEYLLKGKAVIIVDGNPIAIILPGLFFNFTTAKDEIDSPKFFTIFKRILVVFCLFFSIFFLGFFVALMNFHSNALTLRLIASIKITERGTILPMPIEILIVLFFFELYNLSTSHSPLGYVQNIIVLFGGIFIGQNAVTSGFIGSLILMLTSICYISGFAVSNNPRFVTSISILRFILLIVSALFGFVGFFIGSIIIIYYLFSLKSVGVPYLFPFIPGEIKKAMNYFTPENDE